jgi:mannitol/fructose-specific phosphotransferase system IIA component (Ntr-type)
MPVALTELLSERQIALRLSGRDQAAALREIVQLLAANGKIEDEEKFLEDLLWREQTRPSTVDNGVVFPHLRSDSIDEIILGIGRSKEGIPFNGATAHLIFVIGVPQRFANEYLVVVGALARLLRQGEIRSALLAAKNSAQAVATLQRPP